MRATTPNLIDDLPLAKSIDRRYARLSLIGALSWSLFWFKKEGDAPADAPRIAYCERNWPNALSQFSIW